MVHIVDIFHGSMTCCENTMSIQINYIFAIGKYLKRSIFSGTLHALNTFIVWYASVSVSWIADFYW